MTSRSKRRAPPRPPEPPPPPYGRRLIALDVGDRRIGVAVTDPDGAFVARRDIIDRRIPSGAPDPIDVLLHEYPDATLVVGLPLRMDGSEGRQAERTRRWAAVALARRRRIVFRDERLTTDAARRAGARGHADAEAAVLILMDFLREPQT